MFIMYLNSGGGNSIHSKITHMSILQIWSPIHITKYFFPVYTSLDNHNYFEENWLCEPNNTSLLPNLTK